MAIKNSLTSMYVGNISQSKSNENVSIVRTELPPELAENAKYPTGFVAVPNFAVHQPKDGKFATVELGNPEGGVSIQYMDKNGDRQTAKVAAEDLVTAHSEAMKDYRAERAAQAEAQAVEPAKEAEAEAGMEM